MFDEIIEDLKELNDNHLFSTVLLKVARHGEPEEREGYYQEAVAAAKEVGDKKNHALALANLSKFYRYEDDTRSDQILVKAIKDAREIYVDELRVNDWDNTLEIVCHEINKETPLAILEIIKTLKILPNTLPKYRIGSEILRELSAEQSDQLLRELFSSASSIKGEDRCWEAVRVLGYRIFDELQQFSEMWFNSVHQLFHGSDLHTLLLEAPQRKNFPENEGIKLIERVLNEVGNSTPFASSRMNFIGYQLIDLIERYPSISTRVLDIIKRIDDNRQHIDLLLRISPYFSDNKEKELIREALKLSKTINDNHASIKILSSFANYLPKKKKNYVIQDLLEDSRKLERNIEQVDALSTISDCLPPNLRKQILLEALSRARAIQNHQDRAQALQYLIWSIRRNRKRIVVGRWVKPSFIRNFTRFLIKPLNWLYLIIQRNEQKIIDDMLEAANLANDSHLQVSALALLMDIVPFYQKSSLKKEALLIARSIHNPQIRAYALGDIIRRVAKNEIITIEGEILEAAEEFLNKDIGGNKFILGSIAYDLSEQGLYTVLQKSRRYTSGYSLFYAILRVFSNSNLPIHERKPLMTEAILMIENLEGEEKTEAIFDALPYVSFRKMPLMLAEAFECLALFDRDRALRKLRYAANSLSEFGGSLLMQNIFSIVENVCLRWP